ncbi:hypothetical protein SKAU_G00384100 [Synaphobranchus kaupii]|uniref:Uncharacterized protein n=1 Tax=Synaphobranchus kaupii TaxID=118154 RepID=A0A9Q1EE97_SYNKA|nr:hypothetical protein SKAU_G00384100 [Synaphobranchus kaupii]
MHILSRFHTHPQVLVHRPPVLPSSARAYVIGPSFCLGGGGGGGSGFVGVPCPRGGKAGAGTATALQRCQDTTPPDRPGAAETPIAMPAPLRPAPRLAPLLALEAIHLLGPAPLPNANAVLSTAATDLTYSAGLAFCVCLAALNASLVAGLRVRVAAPPLDHSQAGYVLRR